MIDESLDPGSDHLEHRLRSARPQPPADFVRGLESHLGLTARPARRRMSPLLLVTAFAGGLAATTLLLSVLGALPFGRTQAVSAEQNCQIVIVDRVERQRFLVEDADGVLRPSEREVRVKQPERRCS